MTRLNKRDRVKIRQVNGDKEVVVAGQDKGEGCFSTDSGEIIHLADKCYLGPPFRGADGKELPLYEIVSVVRGDPVGWPPQEDDVWKSSNYTFHFFNGGFHHKNMYSDTTSQPSITWVKALDPVLLFRANK